MLAHPDWQGYLDFQSRARSVVSPSQDIEYDVPIRDQLMKSLAPVRVLCPFPLVDHKRETNEMYGEED